MSVFLPLVVALLVVGFLVFWWHDRRRSEAVSKDTDRQDVHNT